MTLLGVARDDAHYACMLHAGVTWDVEHILTMLLEWLPGQDLREQVGGVRLPRNMTDYDLASTTELAHLEQLSIHVTRMLRRREPVAQIERRLAVRVSSDRITDVMTQRTHHFNNVQQLDGKIAQCNQFGFAG